MPTQNIHVLSQTLKSIEEASDVIAKLQKQVRYLQEHIDVDNIIKKSLTADVIKAGAITADEITVTELSALSANLGTIIAGIIRGISIYGSYIATSETYPRTEMDVLGNFLAAISVPGTYLAITPLGSGSVPAISLVAGGQLKGFLNRSAGGMSIGTFDGEPMNLQPAGPLQIGGMNGTSGSYFVSSAPGGPADIQVNFTKGLLTS